MGRNTRKRKGEKKTRLRDTEIEAGRLIKRRRKKLSGEIGTRQTRFFKEKFGEECFYTVKWVILPNVA